MLSHQKLKGASRANDKSGRKKSKMPVRVEVN